MTIPAAINHQFLNLLYNPLQFFRNGEFGAIYTPHDRITLWQDAAGTIPVTASSQPVGRLSDTSGNLLHAKQTNNTLRPTYIDTGGPPRLHFTEAQYLITDPFTAPLLQGGSAFIAANTVAADDLGWTLGEYLVSNPLDRIFICHDTRPDKFGVIYIPGGTSDHIFYDSEMNSDPHVVGYVDEGSIGRLYVDEAAQSDTNTPTQSFAAGDRRIVIGNRSQLDGQFEGDFYGATLIDRQLLTAEIKVQQLWLKARAGL